MQTKNNKDLKERIIAELENVRPSLQADGGDIELVEITDDFKVIVKLLGACGTCPTSIITLKLGVEQYYIKTDSLINKVINYTENDL